MKNLTASAGAYTINAIGLLNLITGGGGAFKQVIIDGGVGEYIAGLFDGVIISPILLSWAVAVIFRICLGSGTVAALSTAGIVLPMLEGYPDANLALVALATEDGTAFASHVNDPRLLDGKRIFWLIIERNICNLYIIIINGLYSWNYSHLISMRYIRNSSRSSNRSYLSPCNRYTHA